MELLEHFIHRFSHEKTLAYAETYRSRLGTEHWRQNNSDQLRTFAAAGRDRSGGLLITLSYPYLHYLYEARECLTTMRGPLDKVPDAAYYRVALYANLLARLAYGDKAREEACRYVVIYGGGPKYNEGGVLDDIKHNPALVDELLAFHRKNRSFQRARREPTIDYGRLVPFTSAPPTLPTRPCPSLESSAEPLTALPDFSLPALVAAPSRSVTASLVPG